MLEHPARYPNTTDSTQITDILFMASQITETPRTQLKETIFAFSMNHTSSRLLNVQNKYFLKKWSLCLTN
jgi:hypothetical protein